MKRGFEIAWICLKEALRDFHLREYAPFGWILVVELVLLVLAFNIGRAWAMVPIGSLSALLRAESTLHYPGFFLFLPQLLSIVEAFLYTIPGSVLIPLALIRILDPMDPTLASRRGAIERLKRAILPTLAASLLGAALLLGWQWVVGVSAGPAIRGSIGGFPGEVATWMVSILGAYAIGALFLYVPIVAVQPDASFGRALGAGMLAGGKFIGMSVIFVYIFSLPALPFLLLTQLRAAYIVEHMRPEIVAVLLIFYATLLSLATYLTYAAAVRLYLVKRAESK